MWSLNLSPAQDFLAVGLEGGRIALHALPALAAITEQLHTGSSLVSSLGAAVKTRAVRAGTVVLAGVDNAREIATAARGIAGEAAHEAKKAVKGFFGSVFGGWGKKRKG